MLGEWNIAAEGGEVRRTTLCKEWITVWSGGGVQIAERKPTVVNEYDYDEEFCHLGYTASVIGSSAAAETELAKISKRATTLFMCKPGLRDCGANIVASVIGPTRWCIPWRSQKHRRKQSKRSNLVMATCSDARLGWRRASRGRCSGARRSLMDLGHCD